MSLRSFLSTVFVRERPATLEQAQAAYAADRRADAAAIYRDLAEGGSAPAQQRLGELYERGDGVLQNVVEAVRWWDLP